MAEQGAPMTRGTAINKQVPIGACLFIGDGDGDSRTVRFDSGPADGSRSDRAAGERTPEAPRRGE